MDALVKGTDAVRKARIKIVRVRGERDKVKLKLEYAQNQVGYWRARCEENEE